jgi:hypothetical protein
MVESYAKSLASLTTNVEIRGMVQVKRKITWADRYGVLEGSMLYYYRRFSDVKPRVVLSMTNSNITPMGKDKKYYMIEIVTVNKANLKMRF